MRPTEQEVVLAAVRHGLGEPEPTVVVPAADAERALGAARDARLVGLLADAVMAGVVVVDDAALTAVRQQWHDELHVCVQLEARIVRTARLLDEAGIRWGLTKGAALAHLDYPDPSMRTFGDADLVVHPDEWTAAFRLLTQSGYSRQTETLPGGYDDRFGKGATLDTEDPLEVDLHRRFTTGRFGVSSHMEDLFAAMNVITLGGRQIPTLDPVGRLLHACFHAMLGRGAMLRAFRDVAQLLLVTGADWVSTFEVARSWRAEAVVAAAIKEAWERLELTIEHPAHERALATRISRKDAQVLEQFPLMPFRKQALTALPRLPPYEIPRYLWALSAGRRLRAVTRKATSATRRRSA